MKKFLFLLAFLISINIVFGQQSIPDTFELQLQGFPDQCTFIQSTTNPSGVYIKYTGNSLGSAVIFSAVCGCWDKVGANEIVYVIDNGDSFYGLIHHPIVSGTGCADATVFG